jgi:signal transduction histidine kinase
MSARSLARPTAGAFGRARAWIPFAAVPTERAVVLVGLLVGAAGGGVALALLPDLPRDDALPLLVLLGLVVVTRLQTLPVLERSSFSVSVVPVLAAGMLLGPPAAVALAMVSGLLHGLVRRLRWYKVVFNCGNYTLAAAAAAAVFHLFGRPIEVEDLPRLLAVAVLAGLTHYLHTFLAAVAIATERRRPALATWSEHFGWLWPHYGVLAVLALLLALAQRQLGPAGAVVFVVPPLMVLYLAKQYTDRAEQHLAAERALNDELTSQIRQRAAAEEENARLAREAGRASALEELSQLKDEFLSTVSHELRSPLGAIKGYAMTLLLEPAELGLTPTTERFVRVIVEASDELEALVGDLLDMSRIGAGGLTITPRPLRLHRLARRVVDRHRLGVHPRRIRLAVPATLPPVDADGHRVEQVLANLLDNALKYGGDAGPIVVAAERREGDVLVSVADEGPGIPADELGRLFDRFQRGAAARVRRVGGVGLGLAICKGIVEAHGGRIWAESGTDAGAPNGRRGTIVRFTLPLATRARAAARPG